MSKMQMVDLMGQYQKIKPEIKQVFDEILESAQFINGPHVAQFSKNLEQYLGTMHVIPCGSGTEAIQIALMALGLKPGDEVITPSFTFIATVEVVALLGLKPVFVDVDKDDFTMDINSLEKAITPNTKAIIPVHLYGQCARMEELLKIANAHQIPVVEDNAQAIGGTYTFSDGVKKKNGTMGLIGCTSFFPSKNLGAYGDGGAIFTDDDGLAEKLRMIANHGQKKRYYHSLIGVNSRLDSLQAAVLDIKLKHLDEYCDARRNVADYYDHAFAGNPFIKTPVRSSNIKHVFHQYTITFAEQIDRDLVKRLLEEKGIPTMIYYPIPCHQQEMFKDVDFITEDLTVTNYLTLHILSLPIHTELTTEALKLISDSVLECVEKAATVKMA